MGERREVYQFVTQYLNTAEPGELQNRALRAEFESLESIALAVFANQLADESLRIDTRKGDGYCMARCGLYEVPFDAFG